MLKSTFVTFGTFTELDWFYIRLRVFFGGGLNRFFCFKFVPIVVVFLVLLGIWFLLLLKKTRKRRNHGPVHCFPLKVCQRTLHFTSVRCSLECSTLANGAAESKAMIDSFSEKLCHTHTQKKSGGKTKTVNNL